jgi:lysozyme family protein
MTGNFDKVLALVLKDEGGFSNNPKDPGGMTNLGVTKSVWEAFVGHEVDEAAMRALTPGVVAPLYRQNYWNRVHGDELPAGVDYAVMDFAVNSGPSRAAKTLQRACGVQDDGAIGPQTMKAVNAADPITLIDTVCDQRLTFLQSLDTFVTFGKGWTDRVQRVKAASEQMQPPAEAGVGQGQG